MLSTLSLPDAEGYPKEIKRVIKTWVKMIDLDFAEQMMGKPTPSTREKRRWLVFGYGSHSIASKLGIECLGRWPM